MEVNGQLHAPAALPPGKEPLVPIEEEAGWAPDDFIALLSVDEHIIITEPENKL